jgi:hypothetical protein
MIPVAFGVCEHVKISKGIVYSLSLQDGVESMNTRNMDVYIQYTSQASKLYSRTWYLHV